MSKAREKIDDVTRGVWLAVEHLVFQTDDTVSAREICREAGIDADKAMKLTKETGYRSREMRQFIRQELAVTRAKEKTR